ncbi:MAG TPA: thioredoxin family protein [Pyrinomonadaceae bacterium]|jgi:peroxiredoxin|nr:thioredoxin family protein [Pyrinomonadaceae bacterium]
MKKLYTCALLFTLSLCAATTSPTASAAGGDDKATGASVGAVVNDFKLPDADGKQHSLASLKGKNGTVLIFVAVQCPVSNAYNERMERLAKDYRARGINVVGINSNFSETGEAVKKHAAEKGLTFPILKDNGNKVADMLGALVTPEAFYLDAGNKLVYRGRIDNSRNGDAITSDDLREALDAALAGKVVVKTEARAFGCSIKRAS